MSRRHIRKSGVKAEIQARLKKALLDEAWNKLAREYEIERRMM